MNDPNICCPGESPIAQRALMTFTTPMRTPDVLTESSQLKWVMNCMFNMIKLLIGTFTGSERVADVERRRLPSLDQMHRLTLPNVLHLRLVCEIYY